MTDVEFQLILNKLGEYLSKEKRFINNPMRQTEIKNAFMQARQLFPDAKITMQDDPLEMGAFILNIEADDITLRGVTEIKAFAEIISAVDNFEIYALPDSRICFAAVFHDALINID